MQTVEIELRDRGGGVLRVVFAGAVEACQASITPGLSATSAGQDLSSAPGGQDTNGDGKIDIVITAATAIAQAATLTVTCRDPFGQTSSGMYSVAP